VDSYYAEHCDKPIPQEINNALKAAAEPTFLGSKFDLQMLNIAVPDAPEDIDDALPAGVTHIDEHEFQQFLEVRPQDCPPPGAMHALVDVASCPQFGLS
jgi:hypothetical protein